MKFSIYLNRRVFVMSEFQHFAQSCFFTQSGPNNVDRFTKGNELFPFRVDLFSEGG